MGPNLVDRLDQEWHHTACLTDDECEGWSASRHELSDCRSPAQVLAAIPRSPDALLGFLIGRHQAGSALAARIVLQAMLGKMVRMSYTGTAAGEPRALDDLVTHMWCQIACYPLARRPSRIAANLALDSLKAAQREWRHHREVPAAPDAVVDELERRQPPEDDDWAAAAVIADAHRLGRITATTRDILLAVYSEGLSGDSAARRWGCSPAAIRTRCRTAIKTRIAPLARELIAA